MHEEIRLDDQVAAALTRKLVEETTSALQTLNYNLRQREQNQAHG